MDKAVVALHTDADAGDRLVSYVTGTVDNPAVLLESLRSALPSYMVPSALVVLDRFPMNASGKLDRKALPEPVFEPRVYRAPVTAMQKLVAEMFGRVLGVERAGLDDDFFALGGHSLLATRLVSRLGAALGVRVPVRSVFEGPTVASLAARVHELTREQGMGRRALVAKRKSPERVASSYAQQRLWFIDRFGGGSVAYNMPLMARLSGTVDGDVLADAVGDVVARHEALRTVFPEDAAGSVQTVLPVAEALRQLQVEVVDVAPERVPELVSEIACESFDLSTRIPVIARVLRCASDDHVLVLVVHHIACDGASLVPLVADVAIAYGVRLAGQAPQWAPLAAQYADYALWQRDLLGSLSDPDSLMSRQVGYWRDRLAGLPECMILPTDRPRPAVASYRGDVAQFEVTAGLHERLERLARDHGATLAMVMQAGLAVLLTSSAPAQTWRSVRRSPGGSIRDWSRWSGSCRHHLLVPMICSADSRSVSC